jgi:hypothetical protein
MKNTIRNPFLKVGSLIAMMAVAGFARVATAQNIAQTPQSQQVAIYTSYSLGASNVKSPVMSFDEVKAITQGSVRDIVGQQLGSVTAEAINAKLAGKFQTIASGHEVSFTQLASSGAAHSITEQHTVQVNVKYEARPIGGILTVKVELVPLFNGIGSASRPVALKTISTSVDNLEEDALGMIVSDLMHQLGSEYAAK